MSTRSSRAVCVVPTALLHQGTQDRCQLAKLVQVGGAERPDPPPSLRSQRQSHDAAIIQVTGARDQPQLLGSIGERNRRVVPDEQIFGNLTDGRPSMIGVAADCEQQLMLRVGQPGVQRLARAPLVEATQQNPECEQPLILGIGELDRHLSTTFRHGGVRV
jgi:hypothetical protein